MNSEQIVSIARQVLLFVGGFIVAKGWIDTATLTTVVGALITLGTSFWATYTRRNNGLVASAAAVPEVTQIVTSPTQASEVTSAKVVSQ